MHDTTRWRLVGLVGLIGYLSAATALAAPPKRASQWCKPGPYFVGCRTFIFVDASRKDITTERPRQLVTEIWYPAVDAARGKPRVVFSSFFGDQVEEAVAAMARFGDIDIKEVDKRLTALAVRDAKKRKGRFPLILFSHGNGGVRMQSVFLTEHLASHGYVVVAPDHTGNAAVACLPEGIVTINAKGSIAAVEDRPRDLSFLIDEMARQDADPKSFLYEGIDLDRIGASGHSFGGITVTICTRDKRIKAILPLAGAAPGATFFQTPVMLMVADQDMTIGESRSKLFLKLYKIWRAEKWLLEFKDAGHYTFSEMHRLKPDYGDGCGKGKRFDGTEFVYWDSVDAQAYIKAYGLAFFDGILRDSAEARKLLTGPSLSPKIRVERSEARSKPTATQ